MIFNRAKLFPHLEEYLQKLQVEISSREKVLLWSLGAAASISSIVPAFLTRHAGEVTFFWVLGAAVFGTLGVLGALRESRKRLPFAEQESLHARRQLKNAMDASGLNYAIPRSVGTVIDECVIAYQRLENAIASPIWQDPALPMHWVTVRDNAQAASKSALNEVFAMAGPHINENWSQRPIRSLVDLVQRFTGTEEIPMEPLPPSFRPALEIADRMRTVAMEIETVTSEVGSQSSLRGNLQASMRLDSVLGEIRSLQTAEDELHLDQ